GHDRPRRRCGGGGLRDVERAHVAGVMGRTEVAGQTGLAAGQLLHGPGGGGVERHDPVPGNDVVADPGRLGAGPADVVVVGAVLLDAPVPRAALGRRRLRGPGGGGGLGRDRGEPGDHQDGQRRGQDETDILHGRTFRPTGADSLPAPMSPTVSWSVAPSAGNQPARSPVFRPSGPNASTRASTRPSIVCSAATTSTVSPAARAVSAVIGPMQATTGGTGRSPATVR